MQRIRLRYLLPAAILAAFVWVAAPALSSQPYLPGAVDFEQRLGAVEPASGLPTAKLLASAKRLGKGPVSYRSAPIEAPARFDLAGLAGELRPLELRARDGGGGWSEWVEAEDGNPVYFGGADELQVRARGWRPSGTLHYVNVSGTTSTASGLLNGARAAINSAFISATSILEPATADAAPAEPSIVTRAEWGANLTRGGCPPREAPAYGTVKAGVIHHTVSANDYTEAEAPGIVLGICRYHRNANGWNDIGYQALVDRFGNTYQGRAGGIRKAVIGAQAQGFNAQTTAVASIGTHTKEAPTQAATKADRELPRMEAHRASPNRQRQDHADLRRRRLEPLPRRTPGAPQQGVRPRDRRPHRVPGRRARRDDPADPQPDPGADRSLRRRHRAARRRRDAEVARSATPGRRGRSPRHRGRRRARRTRPGRRRSRGSRTRAPHS